jgi:hypothetical protein
MQLKKLGGESILQVRQIVDMPQNRGELDVIWTMISDERERQILPIRIHIDKGFIAGASPLSMLINPSY